jgi:hypothetical protein
MLAAEKKEQIGNMCLPLYFPPFLHIKYCIALTSATQQENADYWFNQLMGLNLWSLLMFSNKKLFCNLGIDLSNHVRSYTDWSYIF